MSKSLERWLSSFHWLYLLALFPVAVPVNALSIGRRVNTCSSCGTAVRPCGSSDWCSRNRLGSSKSRKGTALNFLSFNLQGGFGKPDNDEEEEEEEVEIQADMSQVDFPTWAQGLRQWPLYPSSSENESGESDIVTRDVKADTGFLGPLTGLLNLEALLTASGEANTTSSAASGVTPQTVPSSLLNIISLEEIISWDRWAGGLRDRVTDLAKSDGVSFARSAEGLLQQATYQVESLIVDASSAISPSTIEALVVEASQALQNATEANILMEVAKNISLDRGLGVVEAARLARETTTYASNLVKVADSVLRNGYVAGDPIAQRPNVLDGDDIPPVAGSRSLFSNFGSAAEINVFSKPIAKAAEMGAVSGAIYENTLPRLHKQGHTLVAEGRSKDVVWMITDSVSDAESFEYSSSSKDKFLVRTITIRGFDATDDTIDREGLLFRICTATPEALKAVDPVLVHSGLLDIAKSIYADVEKYLDWTAPSHRIALNGHSIGGSLAVLILFLMTLDRGPEFVRRKVLRVFAFGSPPVAALRRDYTTIPMNSFNERYQCDILEAFELPSSIVHGFGQPWDPIIRLFSECDPLYPLVGDIGVDGVTLFSSGPPRTLRPITKAIFEAWDRWPQFRDNVKENGLGDYISVGIQHILLPDPTRYLSDRFVAVNVAVPPVETVMRISSRELLPALKAVFPLTVFELSFIPQALRGFVHHFYPAYGSPLVGYVKQLAGQSRRLSTTDDKIGSRTGLEPLINGGRL